jgi:Lsr2
MARRTVVRLIDDVDGTEATHTVVYGIDGRWWEIDLSDENAGELRDALAPYLSVSRPHVPDGTRGRRRRPGA